MMLGEVDNVDGHYIATKFYGLCIPASSMYVTSYSSHRSGNRTTMTWGGVPIKLNLKSVLIAYPRVWLWFLAFAWPFITHYGENVNDIPVTTWWTMGAFVVLAIASHFVVGRLSAKEKRRLRIFGKITGLRIDPSKLMKWTREEKREFWDKELTKIGITTTTEGIRKAITTSPPDFLQVIYTFCCYSGDDGEWRQIANEIYPKIPLVQTLPFPIPKMT